MVRDRQVFRSETRIAYQRCNVVAGQAFQECDERRLFVRRQIQAHDQRRFLRVVDPALVVEIDDFLQCAQ